LADEREDRPVVLLQDTYEPQQWAQEVSIFLHTGMDLYAELKPEYLNHLQIASVSCIHWDVLCFFSAHLVCN